MRRHTVFPLDGSGDLLTVDDLAAVGQPVLAEQGSDPAALLWLAPVVQIKAAQPLVVQGEADAVSVDGHLVRRVDDGYQEMDVVGHGVSPFHLWRGETREHLARCDAGL